MDSATTTIVIESNATGQFEGLIREHCLLEVGDRFHRYDGRPISPEQVYAKIHSMLGREVELSDAGAVVAPSAVAEKEAVH